MTPTTSPDIRLLTAAGVARTVARLDADGASYRILIVPPRGRTHRRPVARPREFVVQVVRAHG